MKSADSRSIRVHFVSGAYAACCMCTKFDRIVPSKRKVRAGTLRQGDTIRLFPCRTETVARIDHNPS